jgi:hypothetical protein
MPSLWSGASGVACADVARPKAKAIAINRTIVSFYVILSRRDSLKVAVICHPSTEQSLIKFDRWVRMPVATAV